MLRRRPKRRDWPGPRQEKSSSQTARKRPTKQGPRRRSNHFRGPGCEITKLLRTGTKQYQRQLTNPSLDCEWSNARSNIASSQPPESLIQHERRSENGSVDTASNGLAGRTNSNCPDLVLCNTHSSGYSLVAEGHLLRQKSSTYYSRPPVSSSYLTSWHCEITHHYSCYKALDQFGDA